MTNTYEIRPFTIVYNDYMENNIFDNPYQMALYTALKKFADKNGQCFPSLKKLGETAKMCKRKVQSTLLELKDKFLISIDHRKRPDGGYTSNLYTIHDINFTTGNVTENATTASTDTIIMPKEDISDTTVMSIDTASDTITMPEKAMSDTTSMLIEEKRSISAPTKVTDIDTNTKLKIDNTTHTIKSQAQPSERYTLDQIHQHFEYEILIQDPHYIRDDIDSVMSILYTALNTTKPAIRINGEDKPSMVVIGKLMKLNKLDIGYVIDKFKEQTDKIKNPTAYLLTMLYNAPEQRYLDMSNQTQHDMYGKLSTDAESMTTGKLSSPQGNYNQNRPKNQFFQFHQREVTQEELDELERKLLQH